MTIKTLRVAILAGAMALSTVACSSSGIENSYGDAVRSNVRAQVYDPLTIVRPSTDPVEGTDGQRMEAVMEAHRARTGNADNVSTPIVINVGSQ